MNILVTICKIEHQREHFAMLSKDINDFVQTLELLKNYIRIIPMYDEKWLLDK
jgi:hypothetical protein